MFILIEGLDTISREDPIKIVFLPSENRSTQKEKNGSKFFSFRVDSFQNGFGV